MSENPFNGIERRVHTGGVCCEWEDSKEVRLRGEEVFNERLHSSMGSR